MESDFVTAPEQLRRQQSALNALLGQRLQNGWVGWDPERDRWQPNFPVVLGFDGGVQLEIAWQGWDKLSITWNTIDLTIAPTIVGRPHDWRPSQPAPIAAVAGRVLTGWVVTEEPYFPGETDLTGELPMDAASGWVMQGLLFQFDGVGLHVFCGGTGNFVAERFAEPTRLGVVGSADPRS